MKKNRATILLLIAILLLISTVIEMTISDLSYENNKRNYLTIVLSLGLLVMNFPNISKKKDI
jgi:formate hydrogenlyase subunit 3/multisubunit Na+/H+ antiporter MnhD subunit